MRPLPLPAAIEPMGHPSPGQLIKGHSPPARWAGTWGGGGISGGRGGRARRGAGGGAGRLCRPPQATGRGRRQRGAAWSGAGRGGDQALRCEADPGGEAHRRSIDFPKRVDMARHHSLAGWEGKRNNLGAVPRKQPTPKPPFIAAACAVAVHFSLRVPRFCCASYIESQTR